MVTALYRRYRPESFGELIGQSQVTDPLRTALRTDRVNHAYLFSGPRGCGKTTSARILARCLNCAEGPTDTPCGKCDSCVELGRGGGGSLDVVEIDAASHNGVDDARDLRERAVFAPARDRYKIFILDEAHMVTPQGFNALLKIVEEPPEHVKFIFATTEPEKVIGTIRSRTHHYPFRLVPPAQMLEYLGELCASEGITVAAGVLPLVVRAGGGSVRDTLSLLDQLIAGSEGANVEYERAVALLGYTHGALLDEIVMALGQRDAAAAFGAVDRVIQTGQDPRRFVEDLLERLRDLIVVAATGANAGAVLRGVPTEQIESYRVQSTHFGAAELSRAADVVNDALTEMTGATSPRLHLELMIARVLVPSNDSAGAIARVERLERRVGVEGSSGDSSRSAVPAPASAPPVAAPVQVQRVPAPAEAAPAPRVDTVAPAAVAPAAPAAERPTAAPVQAPPPVRPAAEAPSAPVESRRPSGGPVTAGSIPVSEPGWEVRVPGAPLMSESTPPPSDDDAPEPDEPPRSEVAPSPEPVRAAPVAAEPAPAGPSPVSSAASAATAPVGALELQHVRDAWPEVLEAVRRSSISAWTVVYTASPLILNGDVLTLGFVSENDVTSFRQQQASGQGVSEVLRQAIVEVLGTRVKFLVRVDAPVQTEAAAVVVDPSAVDESRRYGEAVVREILGANFLEETTIAPKAKD
ncbi:DNA polymerase III subunit gamma and tau [Amnibacterium flavum]|uniref:DNA polymerase III subunit gamma/tau n=1 Tax=Amnibacterium flavum TaxID=2173173 RepID=A0A2V1HX15_9MICO|nr:DNA polymerase III subunit gamma and tau [Amnibacterium flavum]PVZ95770.1 DNA polymerase III subunit gamma and tau [Amnibacterium flavum]